jgi:hypothetical protein
MDGGSEAYLEVGSFGQGALVDHACLGDGEELLPCDWRDKVGLGQDWLREVVCGRCRSELSRPILVNPNRSTRLMATNLSLLRPPSQILC